MSLTSQVDSLTVNGRTFTNTFNAAARTLTSVSAAGRVHTRVLDTLGRVIEDRAPGVAPVRYSYGPRGFVTTLRQAGRVMQYDYDSSGRVKRTTDPLGRTEELAYDSVGRLTQQTLSDGRVIAYTYDANGNLTSLAPPTKPAHTFASTVGNRDSIYAPPPAGLSSFRTSYQYNLDGQLTRITRPDSLTLDVGYDAAGRLSTLAVPTGQATFTFHPTSGLLSSLTAATGGDLAFTYDGMLPETVTWSGAVAGSVGYTYDTDFRVTALTVNAGNSIGFGYDNDGLLTSAGDLTLTRDAPTARLTRAAIAGDTSSWTFDDSTGVVSRFSATHYSTTLFDVVYSRDSIDRIVQMVETVQGTAKTWAFTYDSIGRLDQVRVNGSLVSDYGYDGNGNRTSLTTPSGSVVGTYDDQDRLLTYGGVTFVHSSNGELQLKVAGSDTTRYTYDVLGNLLEVRTPNGTVIQYLVDGMNRRIGKNVNGVRTQGFLYQGPLAPVTELDGSNQVISRFVYATRVNVPDYMIKAGIAYRIVTDHLGSVRLVVNTATGEVVQRIDYDEYGRVTANTAPGFQPFGFAGGLYDDQTGLVRFGGRDYDAETGRWTTKDPLGFEGGSSNLLAYALEDPINVADPLGEQVPAWLGNGLAGFGDSMTIGLTKFLRRHTPGGDAVDYCSTAYKVGQWSEIGAEVALMGLSAALKHALRRAGGAEVARAAASAYTRGIERHGMELHHIMPLDAHPGGIGGKTPVLFPTGGLPAPVHSGGFNTKLLPRAEHYAAHRRMRSEEDFLRRAFGPDKTSLRALYALCGCE